MKLSLDGVAHLKLVEGVRRCPYKDQAGLLTIGVGHLLTKDELHSGKLYLPGRVVKWSWGLADADLDDLTMQDVEWASRSVEQSVKVRLAQYQFDALVSFCFNIGARAFENSTLVKKLNAGMYEAVPGQMRRWIHAGGQVSEGLKIRREAEVKLWEGR